MLNMLLCEKIYSVINMLTKFLYVLLPISHYDGLFTQSLQENMSHTDNSFGNHDEDNI